MGNFPIFPSLGQHRDGGSIDEVRGSRGADSVVARRNSYAPSVVIIYPYYPAFARSERRPNPKGYTFG